MTSLALKIVMCPLGVIIASWLFTNVQYSAYYQPIIVGLILAGVGIVMEYMFLKKGTLWISTLMDFIASAIIVYFASNLFAGASVSFFGAILTGILLAAIEYFVHHWLIRSGKTQKSPA